MSSYHRSSRDPASIHPTQTSTIAAGRPSKPRPRAASIPASVTRIVTIDEFIEFLCLPSSAPVSLGYSLCRHEQGDK